MVMVVGVDLDIKVVYWQMILMSNYIIQVNIFFINII